MKRLIRRIKEFAIDAMLDGASWARIARSKPLRGERNANSQRPRILLIDELLPDPRFGAGYPRAAAILHALVDLGWDVTMYPLIASRAEHEVLCKRFAAQNVCFVPSRGARGLRRLMRENLASFRVTMISRPKTMRIYSGICAKLPDFKTYSVYDAEAVFTTRELHRLKLFGRPMTDSDYDRALNDEIALTARADALTTVTEAEAMLFRARTAMPIIVVKHSIALKTNTQAFSDRTDLLFVGRCTNPREGSPNVDSLHWFVEEVMPILDTMMTVPYRLLIVGIADDGIISALRSDRVIFMGVVDDLDTMYDRCRVFVAPTRFAAGIPLKVVEAAAAGVPCVATNLLADQLGFHDDVEILASSDALGFAARCAALYTDIDQWTRIRDAAMTRIRTEYSSTSFTASVGQAVNAR